MERDMALRVLSDLHGMGDDDDGAPLTMQILEQ
jgi:hypothetical protein